MKTKRFKVTLEVDVDAPDNATTEDIEGSLIYEFNAQLGLLTRMHYPKIKYEVKNYDIEEQ